MKWDDKANVKLLKSIITRAKLTKTDYAAIAEDMGGGCTATAVYLHIYGMTRSKRSGDDTPEGTPKKAAAAKSPGKTRSNNASASKKRKKCDSMEPEESDCGSAIATPTKKRVKAEQNVWVKKEDEDYVEEIA